VHFLKWKETETCVHEKNFCENFENKIHENCIDDGPENTRKKLAAGPNSYNLQ